MKACNYLIVFCSFLFCLSCSSDIEDQSSDDQILSGLVKDGKNDPELLVGEWDIVSFAYTKDGKKISKAADISDVVEGGKMNCITIPDMNIWLDDTEIEAPGFLQALLYCNCTFYYSLSGNLISFLGHGYCFAAQMTITDKGYEVWNALENAHSFIIKDNELIIHFTGNKNYNLIIFKKR